MNNNLLGMLGTALIAAPLAASAQTTVLDYQGNLMLGSSTYLPTGFTTPNNGNIVLPTTGFEGTFTASITLAGSLAANDLYITSYNLSLNGSNGYSDGSNSAYAYISSPIFAEVPQGGTSFCGSPLGSCIDLTANHGAITGADIEIFSNGYHASTSVFDIGPSGDSYNFQLATTNGTCQNYVPISPGSGGYTVYLGPAINPCSASIGNATAGTWTVTQTPEIDLSFALSGVMLLVGGVAVLRGGRA